MVEQDLTKKPTEFAKRESLQEPTQILKQTNVLQEDVGGEPLSKLQEQVQQPQQQQQEHEVQTHEQLPDKDQENIRKLLSANLDNKDLKMKYDYEISGSDRILLSCPNVNFFTVFQKLEEPGLEEEEELQHELPPSLPSQEEQEQQPQERIQDQSAVSGGVEQPSVILDEQQVKCVIDCMVNTSQRIKNNTLKLQVGSNIHEIFESFSNRKFSFKFNPKTETMLFTRKTIEYPMEFATFFIPSDPTLLRDRRHTSKIYTSIEPYARSWINKYEGSHYIQLMAIVKCGWNIRAAEIPWTEPTRVNVSVHPETQGICYLRTDSIPAATPLSVTERMEVTNRRLRDKGITADSKVQIGGGPTGGTITTPSIILNYQVKNEQELKKIDVEVNKMEFDASLHSDLNCVSWLMERKYSRMRDRELERIDLTLYDPSQQLSRNELDKIQLEESKEPFSDYVNFGVWKWDGQPVNFVFEVEHGYRRMVKTRQMLHLHSQYIGCEQRNNVGTRGLFPIDLKFTTL